jgi:glycosyltransferase involved in cell wall biosynthesis
MSAQKPVFSIITPVYNGEDYLRETIESVLRNATGYSFEYIIINDGSTDGSQDILKSYSDSVRIFSQPNSGESSAVNKGLSLATGTLSLIVSADDPILTPRLFEGVEQIFESSPNLAALYPNWNLINSEGETVKTIKVPDFSFELLIGDCRTLPGPGTFFRTSFANQIGGRNAKWKFVGDFDFWLRLSQVGEIRHRPEVVAQWRSHSGSTSIAQRGLEMALERIHVMETFFENYSIDSVLMRRARGSSYYMAARLAFFSTRVPGKKYLFNSFLYRRGVPETASLAVVLYIVFLPLSRWLVNPFYLFLNKHKTQVN